MSKTKKIVEDIFHNEGSNGAGKKAFDEVESVCWFCRQKDKVNNMDFSWQFDTYLHKDCLVKAIENDEDHDTLELDIIRKEFDL